MSRRILLHIFFTASSGAIGWNLSFASGFVIGTIRSNNDAAIVRRRRRCNNIYYDSPPIISSKTSTTTNTEMMMTTALGAYPEASHPQLNDWKVLSSGSIVGTVTGHPSISDGDVITTSPIQDPDAAAKHTLVQTASGSTYQLLEPMEDGSSTAFFNSQTFMGSAAFSSAATKLNLNMRVVGMTQQYYLAGEPTPSTSGKSNIWEAYRADMDGVPTEPPLCVKISTNLEAVSREFENYQKLAFGGLFQDRFVKCFEYLPVAGYEEKLRDQCALVLEMGSRDLKSFLDSRGRLQGSELLEACKAAAQCVQAVHSAGLVWTDIKTENFVVMPNGEVKGIDLESAMPNGGNPVDYSPEACPPEFATSFEEGDAHAFVLDYSYDIWSLGMLYLELASGRGVFDHKEANEITKLLRQLDKISLDDLEGADCDPNLRDMIEKCLQRDPQNRPSISQLMAHPYLTNSLTPSPFFLS